MNKIFTFKNIALAILFILVVLLGINDLTSKGKENIVPQAAASYPPEVSDIMEQIQSEQAKYNSGSVLIDKGNALITQGQIMKNEAEYTARGFDQILCARYKYRLDRVTNTLIADENCPLL